MEGQSTCYQHPAVAFMKSSSREESRRESEFSKTDSQGLILGDLCLNIAERLAISVKPACKVERHLREQSPRAKPAIRASCV